MRLLLLMVLLGLPACSLWSKLPEQAPPLTDMEEPLDLRREPDDEAERQQLPLGSFSGLEVEDARDTLAGKLDADAQLRITRIIENSPAEVAGLRVDDLLLAVGIGEAAVEPLRRPSDWRRIELTAAPGTKLLLVVDRAGREAETSLELVPRLRPPARTPTERFREEERVGVVLRTATDVEARAAELAPGAGAVITGLATNSPWRQVGLRYGDLLVRCDGSSIAHPQDLLLALRKADRPLRLEFLRSGQPQTVQAPVSRREREVREISLPPLFDYERRRNRTEWALLLGAVHYRSTAAAWRFRLLWIFGFGAGDADRLLEVGK